MTELLFQRWKRGYEHYMKKDYSNALSIFALIELSFLDQSLIPKEITFNKILALIATNNHEYPLEVGSKLLRSDLGPFFLFAVGLHQQAVNPEISLDSFKKCLISLRDSKEKQLIGNSWILSKFMIMINLAIISAFNKDSNMANEYLMKAKDLAYDEESKTTVQRYLENGFVGVSCIGFPTDMCIPPPRYISDEVPESPEVTKKEAAIENASDIEKIQRNKFYESSTNILNTKAQTTVQESPEVTKKEAVIENVPVIEKIQRNKLNESSTKTVDNLNTKAQTNGSVSEKRYRMLPTPPVEDEKKYFSDDQKDSESQSPPFYKYLEKPKAIETRKDSVPSRQSSKMYSPVESKASFIEEKALENLDYFKETAYVQVFGIWRPFAVLLDGKVLKLCNEKLKSQVDLEIPLDKCFIEPATESSFGKLHLFKLVNEADVYIFALENLTTSLEWISKIMKVSLDLPMRPIEVKLLKTGIGREPISPEPNYPELNT